MIEYRKGPFGQATELIDEDYSLNGNVERRRDVALSIPRIVANGHLPCSRRAGIRDSHGTPVWQSPQP